MYSSYSHWMTADKPASNWHLTTYCHTIQHVHLGLEMAIIYKFCHKEHSVLF